MVMGSGVTTRVIIATRLHALEGLSGSPVHLDRWDSIYRNRFPPFFLVQLLKPASSIPPVGIQRLQKEKRRALVPSYTIPLIQVPLPLQRLWLSPPPLPASLLCILIPTQQLAEEGRREVIYRCLPFLNGQSVIGTE